MIRVDSHSYKITAISNSGDTKDKAKLLFKCTGDTVEVERLVTAILDLIQGATINYKNTEHGKGAR
jgi:hypothetical protein